MTDVTTPRVDAAVLAGGVVEDLRVEEIGPEVLASCDPHGLLFVNVNTPHDRSGPRDSAAWSRIVRRIVS